MKQKMYTMFVCKNCLYENKQELKFVGKYEDILHQTCAICNKNYKLHRRLEIVEQWEVKHDRLGDNS